MPCYRCGKRQIDPARGAGAWRRGVRGDEQVLVCPDCQSTPTWAEELDRCEACGSTALVRRLGRTACPDCGQMLDASRQMSAAVRLGPDVEAPPRADAPPGADEALAHDVAAAIDRVLGRSRS